MSGEKPRNPRCGPVRVPYPLGLNWWSNPLVILLRYLTKKKAAHKF